MGNVEDPEAAGDRATGQREATRRRLVEAAIARFRRDGYAATTAASIAADAGVTERTFFRHFPTKTDVLVANWERHGDALREVLDEPGTREVLELVRDALVALAQRVRFEIADALDTVVEVYSDRAAYLAIAQTIRTVEDDIAGAIARRAARSDNNVLVRVVANASVGVFRAAMRASVADGDLDRFTTLIEVHMERLRGLFDGLSDPGS